MIKVLDCTLRDGGYCNNWQFGKENISAVINGLVDSKIDFVECGFLNSKVAFDANSTKLPEIENFSSFLPKDRGNTTFVCMANFGDCTLDDIPNHEDNFIDGIRVAFHKKDMIPALEFCRGIKQKGYKIFIQAMVSLNYSDEEFLQLLKIVNEIEPHAFYIVDSFGVMKRRDLLRIFYIVEHNLKKNISIGYHSHNNLQLSYSNAQTLADIRAKHDIIIDSSIFGMGRGAGNLNTELFIDYLNDNLETNYKVRPLLHIIDNVLMYFYYKNSWGYSLPNYLSAKHNAHPNYAAFLDDKKKLTIEAMDEIFHMMDKEKRARFDKSYIESLYLRYMIRGSVNQERYETFQKVMEGKTVLLVAPGKSSLDEKNIIVDFVKNSDVIVISVNFLYDEVPVDFIFLGNMRRFQELPANVREKCIVTSDIPAVGVYMQTDYAQLLNDEEFVKDNAGLMAIKLLIGCDVEEIFLAGFDGYSHDVEENYLKSDMTFVAKKAVLDAMNQGFENVINELSKEIPIKFLTKEKFIHLR